MIGNFVIRSQVYFHISCHLLVLRLFLRDESVRRFGYSLVGHVMSCCVIVVLDYVNVGRRLVVWIIRLAGGTHYYCVLCILSLQVKGPWN